MVSTAQAGSFIWIIMLFGIMYFLMIRPQQMQQRRRREMLAALRRGDRIVTVGGIYGTILEVRPETVLVKIADRVEIELSKNGVGAVVKSKAEAREEMEKELEREVKKEKPKRGKAGEDQGPKGSENGEQGKLDQANFNSP